MFYDDCSGSCALLLWRNFAEFLKDHYHYGEMVEWAEKIDSAAYSSVEEAVLGMAPALEINFSLIMGNGQEYCEFLVRQLRYRTLGEVAQLPEVRVRVQEVRRRMNLGLNRLKNTIKLEPGGIAVFEAEQTEEDIISRYAPYYFYPDARYSIGLVRSAKGAKITAMRNPWRNFASISLGKLFEEHGGGGHQRVASVLLRSISYLDGQKLLQQLVGELRSQDALLSEGAGRGVFA